MINKKTAEEIFDKYKNQWIEWAWTLDENSFYEALNEYCVSNSATVVGYNFGHCKDCKHWDTETYGAGESNERQCKRIKMNGSAQFIDNDNWDGMPGAYIWLQTETEDGLGGEVIGIDSGKKEVYINSLLSNYREKIDCDFITTADYGCMLFESKQ